MPDYQDMDNITVNSQAGNASNIIPAVVNAAGQVATGIFGIGAARKNRKWNEKMYKMQRADNIAAWERQNAYNSPSAQMARLKAAGLNPNLIYGNGADQTAGAIQGADVKPWSPNPPQFDGSSIMSSINDTRLRDAQIDNLEMETELKKQSMLLQAATLTGKITQNEISSNQGTILKQTMESIIQKTKLGVDQLQAGISKTLADTQFTLSSNERAQITTAVNVAEAVERIAFSRARREDLLPYQVAELKARIDNMRTDGSLKQLELKMAELGIYKGDSLYQRVIAQVVSNLTPMQKANTRSILSGVDGIGPLLRLFGK